LQHPHSFIWLGCFAITISLLRIVARKTLFSNLDCDDVLWSFLLGCGDGHRGYKARRGDNPYVTNKPSRQLQQLTFPVHALPISSKSNFMSIT
jgi:hypothetical protein